MRPHAAVARVYIAEPGAATTAARHYLGVTDGLTIAEDDEHAATTAARVWDGQQSLPGPLATFPTTIATIPAHGPSALEAVLLAYGVTPRTVEAQRSRPNLDAPLRHHSMRATVIDQAPPAFVTHPPRKRRGLTGKAYRIARRGRARRVRAWRRAGSPTEPRALAFFIPRVTVAERDPGAPLANFTLHANGVVTDQWGDVAYDAPRGEQP